ncbi:proteasome subunit alpha type-7-1-related [Anaeramoeba flamelloides]|uniref:Proteasome subunit alpha type n=1 Tax=Anaeramoeba flamelloides TaxID=1746091 RepID=A0AAV7YBQ2_9EUKA|nr:proteasome subunit alpha type-7-1-related [Anaeramoeba flamelloides]
MSYDRAITVFSPDGHLIQVEYALEAVKKGTTAVGVKGKDVLVLGVEKKSTAKLQDPRTVRKIVQIDDHICMTFAGLTADSRILINKARFECQSYKYYYEDPIGIEYITRYIAKTQQKYTQSVGVRPFGVSTLIVGYDSKGFPKLYQTDPSGNFSSWKASCIGRSEKPVKEFLEKNYVDEMDEEQTVRLTIQSLVEVVESGEKNIDIAIMRKNKPIEFLGRTRIAEIVKEFEEEKKRKEEED